MYSRYTNTQQILDHLVTLRELKDSVAYHGDEDFNEGWDSALNTVYYNIQELGKFSEINLETATAAYEKQLKLIRLIIDDLIRVSVNDGFFQNKQIGLGSPQAFNPAIADVTGILLHAIHNLTKPPLEMK